MACVAAHKAHGAAAELVGVGVSRGLGGRARGESCRIEGALLIRPRDVVAEFKFEMMTNDDKDCRIMGALTNRFPPVPLRLHRPRLHRLHRLHRPHRPTQSIMLPDLCRLKHL